MAANLIFFKQKFQNILDFKKHHHVYALHGLSLNLYILNKVVSAKIYFYKILLSSLQESKIEMNDNFNLLLYKLDRH